MIVGWIMAEGLFLTADELRQYTGVKHKQKQVKHLLTLGVPFDADGCGRPIVLRAAVIDRLSVRRGRKSVKEQGLNLTMPKFSGKG